MKYLMLLLLVAGLLAPLGSAQGAGWTRETAAASWKGRREHASVVFDNRMWVLGGSAAGDLNDVWSSKDGINWVLETDSANWSPRSGHSAVVFNGKMWVLGNSEVWSSSDGITWTLESSSIVIASGHVSVVHDGRIWVYGGSTSSSVRSTADGVNWTVHTSSAAWPPRKSHAGVSFNNAIWTMGGTPSGGPLRNDVWYSTDGASWTEATSSANWIERYGHTAVVADNKIWLMGGHDGSSPYSREVWTSSDGANWTLVTANADWEERFKHTCVVYNDRLWVMGGYPRRNDVWSYPIPGTSPRLEISTPSDLPDGTAGTAYSASLNATGGAPGYSWSLFGAAQTLPAGWTLSGNGSLSASAQHVQPGTYIFNATVEDTSGTGVASRAFSVTILPATGGGPGISTSSAPPDGIEGVEYNLEFHAVGGAAPYTWSLASTSAALPGGWVLDQNGELHAPAQNVTAGTVTFEAEVTDGNLVSVSKPITITINSPGAGGVAQTWTQATASAAWAARSGHCSVVFQNRLWVMGGLLGGVAGPQNDVWSSADGINWTLETAAAGWARRSHFSAVVFNDLIWVIGGVGGDLNDVWYSPDGANWNLATSNAPWPQIREHTAVAHRGRIWLMGGAPASGFPSVNEVWSSADGIHWTQEPAATWTERRNLKSAVFGSNIWIAGGGTPYLNDASHTSNAGSWKQTTAAAPWVERGYHDMVAANNRIWLMGGKDNSVQSLNDVWSTGDGVTWVQETAAAPWSARHGHSCAVFNNHIWMLGGDDGAYRNDVWSLSLTGGGAALAITTPTTLPDATEGTAYNFTFSASGGTPPYSWFPTTGGASLPAGWSLDADGNLSADGSDVVAGVYTFDVSVSDTTAVGLVSDTFSVTVNPAGGGGGQPPGTTPGSGGGGGGCVASVSVLSPWLIGLLAFGCARRRRESSRRER